MNNRIVQAAKEVIKTEALALEQLAQNLPRDFEKVVDLISKLKGHLIISGVGKSGHIGRKISATLASTEPISLCSWNRSEPRRLGFLKAR